MAVKLPAQCTRVYTRLFGASRALASSAYASRRQKHTLPGLPYDYGALEPHILGEIMELHHSKHHQTYVNNLIVAEEKMAEAAATGDTDTVIQLGPAVRFNGGGHINHSIFWTNLSPNGGGEPDAETFEDVQKEVAILLQGRILVGHAVHNDLKALLLSHPWRDTRDTSKYKPFKRITRGKTPSLKRLAKEYLGKDIQKGEHTPVEDAQAAMCLFQMHKKDWEARLRKKKRKKD